MQCTADRSEGHLELGGDLALFEALVAEAAAVVDAVEAMAVHVGIEVDGLGPKLGELEREKSLTGFRERVRRHKAFVENDVMRSRAEMFDVTDLVGPAAMADRKNVVGVGADGACREESVGGERFVGPRSWSVGNDQQRKTKPPFEPQQPAHHMTEISVSHQAEVKTVERIDDRDTCSRADDDLFDLLENKVLHPADVLRLVDAEIDLKPVKPRREPMRLAKPLVARCRI